MEVEIEIAVQTGGSKRYMVRFRTNSGEWIVVTAKDADHAVVLESILRKCKESEIGF